MSARVMSPMELASALRAAGHPCQSAFAELVQWWAPNPPPGPQGFLFLNPLRARTRRSMPCVILGQMRSPGGVTTVTAAWA